MISSVNTIMNIMPPEQSYSEPQSHTESAQSYTKPLQELMPSKIWSSNSEELASVVTPFCVLDEYPMRKLAQNNGQKKRAKPE